MLEALYGHISSLGKSEADSLMEEDPDVMQRRAATRKVSCYLLPNMFCGNSPLAGKVQHMVTVSGWCLVRWPYHATVVSKTRRCHTHLHTCLSMSCNSYLLLNT